MPGSSQEKRSQVLRELGQELRQFYGLGASFFRAAAARLGMTVTDMQVIDLLESAGPSTAGQLAELTGLTTGAITGMINRLEEAGIVRRERDPNDGRRVIVRLTPDKGTTHEIGPIFDSLGEAWDEMASHYDDEQLAFVLEFLKRSNTISRQEIARLREASSGNEDGFSAPLGDFGSGRLVVSSAISQLILRTDHKMAELYQAHFEGSLPDVKVKEGVVTIRYPRRLWVPGSEKRAAEVTLSEAIPWQIVIQGGASEVIAELGKLNLSGLEVKGGLSSIHLELPTPSGVVPIRFSGGASDVTIRRPKGVAARAHLKGWASTFVFDDQAFSNMGNDVRLQSPDFDLADSRYDIEVASSVSMVTITTS